MPIALLFVLLLYCPLSGDDSGMSFLFKERTHTLKHPMQRSSGFYHPRDGFNNKLLDTLSNWYDAEARRVEIIRQDHPSRPTFGLALAFEFEEENGEYPYTPAYAVLQLKDFGWGGVEFSQRDTMNYTGVSNQVSDDITVEILDFQNDTITGRFFGLLLNGAGTMTEIEEGWFKIGLYRR